MSRNNGGKLDIDLSKLDVFQSSWSILAIIIEGKLRFNQSRQRGNNIVDILL